MAVDPQLHAIFLDKLKEQGQILSHKLVVDFSRKTST
jgi:hypothetical protein